MQTDAEPADTPQSVERRLGAAAAQIEYMTTEIAKALEQEPGNAADTVWMVRTFANITAEREAALTAEVRTHGWISVHDALPPEYGSPPILITKNPASPYDIWLARGLFRRGDSRFAAHAQGGETITGVTHWRYALPDEDQGSTSEPAGVAAAWLEVERLTADGFRVLLEWSPGRREWECTWERDGAFGAHCADTAPLAIRRAAKQAGG